MKFKFRSEWRRRVSARRVKGHAKEIFQFLFPQGFPGEVFLCGGAFKPLFDEKLAINDLDLWVRNRKERERIVAALIEGGAKLVHDFAPYCIKLEMGEQAIEVTYHNVKDGGIADIVGGFDLACSAIGASYRDGAVREVYISENLKRALAERVVLLENSYLASAREERSPDLLRGIDRMCQFAADIGYSVDPQTTEECWEIFEKLYSAEEKQRCIDIYRETVVDYKSRCNDDLLERANGMVLSS